MYENIRVPIPGATSVLLIFSLMYSYILTINVTIFAAGCIFPVTVEEGAV